MTSPLTTLAWPEIVGHYEALAQRQASQAGPMPALVRFLATSRYAPALFPALDGDVLRIGRRRDFAPGVDEIQVRFDPASQRVWFMHLQRAGDAEPWSRECEAADWEPALHRLLHRRLQWFHEG